MKIQKKIIVITIFSISILMGILGISSRAANETTTRSNQTATPTKTTNTTTQTSNQKSNVDSVSNANLSMLGIRPHDFTGFKYGTTSYKVEVPSDTESIEVYATAQEAKATVTGTGKKNLEMGENKFDVAVTAQNGNKRTYTITVVRGSATNKTQEEKTSEEKESKEDQTTNETNAESKNAEKSNGLAKLTIKDLTLSPTFETNVYEYTVKYIGEDSTLNIETEATDENYSIEIIGNAELQEGENLITILVSEKNGENVATYQVTVNKSLVDEEALAKEAEGKAKQQRLMRIIAGVIGIIVVILIIIKIMHKRNKKREEDFLVNPYYRDYDDYDDYDNDRYEERVPKAFNREVEERTYSNFGSISKDEAKEQFLKGYTSQYDIDFGERYQEDRSRGKHKGKRFK